MQQTSFSEHSPKSPVSLCSSPVYIVGLDECLGVCAQAQYLQEDPASASLPYLGDYSPILVTHSDPRTPGYNRASVYKFSHVCQGEQCHIKHPRPPLPLRTRASRNSMRMTGLPPRRGKRKHHCALNSRNKIQFPGPLSPLLSLSHITPNIEELKPHQGTQGQNKLVLFLLLCLCSKPGAQTTQ